MTIKIYSVIIRALRFHFILLTLTAAPGFQPLGFAADSPLKSNWKTLDQGLALGTFPSPTPSVFGDSLIRVLRIDPNKYKFHLLNTSAASHGKTLTAKQWCKRNGLIAAINASMYQKDHKASVSYMRTRSHINNPRISKDNTILAFGRKRKKIPYVKIIDRQCEDFNVWKNQYTSFVQSIRMISCKGKNVWQQQASKWSTAAIGIDRQGNILFIHVRSPFSTHDLINILLKLPLDISRAMYVEGGPEAQVYINSNGREYEFTGSYETHFNENNLNNHAWPVPNVVGISARKTTP